MASKIRDIMSQDVKTATPDTPIKEVAVLMKSKNIGSLPVCEGRRVVGVITDRDITVRGVAEGRDPGITRARELMSTEIVTVRDDSDLMEAERLMHDFQLRRLPVVNELGELVGYLAMAHVARTASPEEVGNVAKGVSHPSKPAPLEAVRRKKHRKTG